MRFHPSVIESIILACRNYGGHASEKKLRDVLSAKRYAAYSGERSDVVLVDAGEYMKAVIQQGRAVTGMVPMALHANAFERIMYLFDLYSGYDNEQKLRNALVALDLTPYEKKTGVSSGETILVLTEEYNRVLQGTPKR